MSKASFNPLRSIEYVLDERKAASAAACLIKLHGGRTRYIRLIKLLYMADRESLRRFNRPIIGDRYVAMKQGPVLSGVLRLVKREVESGPWDERIMLDGYDVALRGEVDLGPLSEAEVDLLKEVYEFAASMTKWQLIEYIHKTYPEWKDPGSTSVTIEPEAILRALNKSAEEIEEARQESVEKRSFDRIDRKSVV